MPTQSVQPIRRLLAPLLVIVLAGTLFLVARMPAASAAERSELAAPFHFTEMPIKLPPGLPQNTIRPVNPEYYAIRAWISSVGASIAFNDIQGTGVADDLCLVDTRSDSVVVTPAPGTGDRYEPFVLDAAPTLPMGPAIAPMGCAPGDFNGDGRMDILVYYWGRTPVIFLHNPGVTKLSPAAFTATELVPQAPAPDDSYHGPLWNTNAVAIADFDGDGHPDIGVFNYFPDTAVLDPNAPENVHMNHSMSRATNGGGAHIMRWVPGTAGTTLTAADAPAPASYVEESGAVPPEAASGWTLGSASADIDGDLLPELYVANDFGNDHLFHNMSTRGHIKFEEVKGQRGAFTPKSMVLGHDSFKGMSADFGDIGATGKFDIFVSNITTSWGLEESNFLWMNNASSPSAAKASMDKGIAPYDNKSADLNIAWTGWGWDAKMADFDNSGYPQVVQADGFVKGDINRWPWLQELAMGNDTLLENPTMWPKAGPGDDIAGSQRLAFWVRGADGGYTNVSANLGLDVPIPTRGIAVADTTGDGAEDFAVARQWGAPAFYHNDNGGHPSNFLGLRLYRPATDSSTRGTPAYGAQVLVTTADGHTQIAQLDGGGGHSGKRSFDVFFGLGNAGDKPVSAALSWRDTDGTVHHETLNLSSGWHDFLLTNHAAEVTAS